MTDEGYVGDDVHFAARVAASAHGGQVVLSQTTRRLSGWSVAYRSGRAPASRTSTRPSAIYQLGEESFPPLKTIYDTNLPCPPRSFVGRERELAEVLALVSSEGRGSSP